MRIFVIYLLIMLLFYVNLIDSIFPRLMDTISVRWPFFYIVFLPFLLYLAVQKKIILGKWLAVIVLFCLIVFLSIFWSPFYSYDRDTIVRFIARYMAPVLIVIIASNVIIMQKHIDLYARHFTIVAAVLSVIALVQTIFSPPSSVNIEEGFRASATLVNPNILAIFLVLSVPCVLYCIDKARLSPVIGNGILCIISLAMISTASRKGIVTFLLCMLLYYILKSQWKKIAVLFTLAVVLIAMMFTIASINPRFRAGILQRELKHKTNFAIAGLSMFTTSPLIGLGYQGFYENYGRYTKNVETKKYDAHNMYITVLVDQGIIGFIPFLCIFVYPLILSVRYLKRKASFARDIGVVCITTIVPLMINGFFAGAMFITQSTMFVFFAQISICLNVFNYAVTNASTGDLSQTLPAESRNLQYN